MSTVLRFGHIELRPVERQLHIEGRRVPLGQRGAAGAHARAGLSASPGANSTARSAATSASSSWSAKLSADPSAW
ncbi:MAG: hypothetical protein JNN03_02710 [Rubrivivax sp.]|nr:hypothetical protein [Rubrivivax sp.]